MSAAISRFAVPDLNEVPGDIRARIVAVQEKAGLLPNVFFDVSSPSGRVSRFF